MATIKAGTCPSCARAVTQDVARYSPRAGWDWVNDLDGPFIHWARPRVDGLYKDGFVARSFDTACGAQLIHRRRA